MTKTMTHWQNELEAVCQLKQLGGFHYVRQAQSLKQTAQHARRWSALLRTPIVQLKSTLGNTRYILDELKAMGID